MNVQPLSLSKRHRRIWPLLPVLIMAAVCLVLGFTAAFTVAQWLFTGEVASSPEGAAAALKEINASRLGFMLMVVVPQITLLIPAVVAALLSPLGFRRRLGLVRGTWPMWGWFAAALATPLVGLIASVFVGLFATESEGLKETAELFRHHGRSGFLLPLGLIIGGLPAICEELLFRGYLQTRLTSRLGGVAGVLIASLIFAAFHFDPVHVLAVFPIGLWMGFVTFRSGSLIPAMIAHFLNNVLAVLQIVFDPSDQPEMLALPSMMPLLFILGTGMLGLMGTAVATILYAPQPTSPAVRSNMLSFFRKIASRRSARKAVEKVPCPHCGADVPETAAACRHCGYDWESGPDEGIEEGYADDDFDYESFVEEEFGSEEFGQRQTSLSLPSWQRAIVVVLVIAFVLWLLGPALF